MRKVNWVLPVVLLVTLVALAGCKTTLTGDYYGSIHILDPGKEGFDTTKLTVIEKNGDLKAQWEGVDLTGTVTSNQYIELSGSNITMSGEVIKQPKYLGIEALVENNTDQFKWKNARMDVSKMGVFKAGKNAKSEKAKERLKVKATKAGRPK